MPNFRLQAHAIPIWNKTKSQIRSIQFLLTLYEPGGGGLKKLPLRFFALTHLILELHYCALVTFPKN